MYQLHSVEEQYMAALKSILVTGTWQENRTGIDSIKSPFPIVITHRMEEGYPALTGRKAPVKSAIAEMIGFMRGVTSAADFRALGCKYWDQNANENTQWLANPFREGPDDLGDVYGAQWRRWPAYQYFKKGELSDAARGKLDREGWQVVADSFDVTGQDGWVYFKEIDQLGDCVRTIINNPNDRRILMHAWNPAKLGQIALPACHLLYQFVPTAKTKELALSVTVRSNDMPLGWPSNMMEAAFLLQVVAHLTGYTPSYVTLISNDAHIYANQLDMVDEYLSRETHPLPRLVINDRVPTFADHVLTAERAKEGFLMNELTDAKQQAAEAVVKWLNWIEPSDFTLDNYVHGEPISAPMAV
jgi:thymidylate synthase